MRLDRNTNPDGTGKYALIKLRLDPLIASVDVNQKGGPVDCLCVDKRAVDIGSTPDTEFFVIRLKDKYAANALQAYAVSCKAEDPEFSRDIKELAMKARRYQNKQIPT